MKKQFETREALLQDALDYYWGKPERQCLMKGSTNICSYVASDTSEGCAIGRLVDESTAKELQETNESLEAFYQFNLLPDWLKNMGGQFLRRIQVLHDSQHFAKKDKEEIIFQLNPHIDFSKIKFPEE